MGGKSAKGLLDRGQHGWLLPNLCRGDRHNKTRIFVCFVKIRHSRISGPWSYVRERSWQNPQFAR